MTLSQTSPDLKDSTLMNMLGGKLRVEKVSGFWKEAEFTEVRPLGVACPASCCIEVTSRATCCTVALSDYGFVLLLRLHVRLIWYLLLCGVAGSGFGSSCT
jgi:hypothetical protein